jgi:uncharacterized protein HemY
MENKENERIKRINQIESMLNIQPEDPFLTYALALEWANCDEDEKAKTILENLIEKDPEYIASYYQLGKIFEKLEQTEEAKATYKAGIAKALQQKDNHTLSELRSALQELEFDW